MMRRRGGGGFGILLLIMQIFNVGVDNIPSVTLGTIILQAGVFLGFLQGLIPNIRGSCVSLHTVYFGKDWPRLFFAALVHGDDMHLYFNMVSFLWKGKSLEPRLGSKYFAYLLVVFSAVTHVVLLALNFIISEHLNWNGYYYQCAVGFSGVIFALKVLTTYQMAPGLQYVMGFIPVHSRLACWAELVLIQVMVPNASFTGHLAGILVGLAYVYGPLRWLMDSVYSVIPGGEGAGRYQMYGAQENYRGRATGYSRPGWRFWGGAQPYQGEGQRSGGRADDQWAQYGGGLSEEEQIRRATEESMSDNPYRAPPGYADTSAPPPGGHPPYPPHTSPYPPPGPEPPYPGSGGSNLYPDLDDVRRRRLQRFSQD